MSSAVKKRENVGRNERETNPNPRAVAVMSSLSDAQASHETRPRAAGVENDIKRCANASSEPELVGWCSGKAAGDTESQTGRVRRDL